MEQCRAFREWLRHAQFSDESEIHSQIGSLRTRLGTLVHGITGKVIRFAVCNGAGVVNPVLGIVLSAIDGFVLENILPISGPAMFLDSAYKSLFSSGL